LFNCFVFDEYFIGVYINLNYAILCKPCISQNSYFFSKKKDNIKINEFTVVYPIRNGHFKMPYGGLIIVHRQKGRCEDFDYYRSL
jgi:hypothetical protein